MNEINIAATDLKNTRLYRKIIATKEKKQKEKEIDDEEAEEMAWEDRQFALKLFLRDNKKGIEEWVFPEDAEDEE